MDSFFTMLVGMTMNPALNDLLFLDLNSLHGHELDRLKLYRKAALGWIIVLLNSDPQICLGLLRQSHGNVLLFLCLAVLLTTINSTTKTPLRHFPSVTF